MIYKPKNLCTEFLDSLPSFMSGTLSSDDFLRLESHRKDCARCAKALLDEERVQALMAEIPSVEVSSDFRDRVLRAWRVKRDTVRESIPTGFLTGIQIALGAVVVILLFLPMVRLSLYDAAHRLTGALDRLPPEYREGLKVSFELPTIAEINANIQIWQGQFFEWLGNAGSALAPWSSWLWGLLILAIIAGLAGFLWIRPVRTARTSNLK